MWYSAALHDAPGFGLDRGRHWRRANQSRKRSFARLVRRRRAWCSTASRASATELGAIATTPALQSGSLGLIGSLLHTSVPLHDVAERHWQFVVEAIERISMLIASLSKVSMRQVAAKRMSYRNICSGY